MSETILAKWTCRFSSLEENQRKKVIGYILDNLAKIFDGLISQWKTFQVIAKDGGKYKSAPEGTWVPVSGNEILFRAKPHKSSAWEKI